MLFNLYSEFIIREATKDVIGIRIGGINNSDLRNADVAVLLAGKKEENEDAR